MKRDDKRNFPLHTGAMISEQKTLRGFGNHFESEAVQGTLPRDQNSPRQVPGGLYAEQLSGTAFTAPRSENRRTWFYRLIPSVVHGTFSPSENGGFLLPEASELASPNQMRWDPLPESSGNLDFVQSFSTFAASGSPETRIGCAVHLYSASRSMEGFLYDSDGELLIVPYAGKMLLRTECGELNVSPGEIASVPRGMKFQVRIADGKSLKGYVCENFGEPFRIPGLGLIGANGLADPRHFETPVAAYEDKVGKFKLVNRFQGKNWECSLGRSPLDVVAWHGNLVPYKYDLTKFQPVGSISVDHPDPSIFTVLTSPSTTPGTANVDFVIFPPRWLVAQHTFRPPYYHRNVMSEFMGLIWGQYDAKKEGFLPGGSSLHNCMSAHGPDAETFLAAIKADDKPQYLDKTLAFMFESSLPFRTTALALSTSALQKDYLGCWRDLKVNFNPKTT